MTKKILIVDNEVHIRSLLEQTLEELEEEGVSLVTASDGEEALEAIQKEKPQLVFLDLMMPKINGFEVCEAIKGRFQMHEVFIIILTAKGQQFDKEKGVKAGADLYMTKPFNPDTVLEKAREILRL
jgi:two-component system, OmpR family, alkaline phosphatase synthesis response regulator PhoP